MKYLYMRASTNETKQSLQRQEKFGRDNNIPEANWFKEYASGANNDRIELNRLLSMVKENDEIYAIDPSRVTRSLKFMMELLDLAKEKNDLMKYFKSALNYGTKWYDFNFTSLYNKLVNFTNPNEIPKEMLFYTPEEYRQFIAVEEDIKFRCVFETLYYCGLRRGELRGLVWKNIDFENKELSIVQNVVNVSGDSGYWNITTPKTKSSRRTVPMPDVLVKDLLKLKEQCYKYYGFNDKWFVFGDINPLHPDVLRRRKNDNAKKAGVKQIRIHDFRHSCASLLINNGANITLVAKYLGHTKVDETLNTYSHMFKNKLNDIVNLINDLNKQ